MIEINGFYRIDGNRDILTWNYDIDDQTTNAFLIQEQIIALMLGWA